MSDKVPCRTPTSETATKVPGWKFDACRKALLQALGDGEVFAREIAVRAGDRLDPQTRATLGPLGWHLTTVRLELEVRGEIERVEGASPVVLRRAT